MSLHFHQVVTWFTHWAKLNPLDGVSQILPSWKDRNSSYHVSGTYRTHFIWKRPTLFFWIIFK
jgi:hypothetical protein